MDVNYLYLISGLINFNSYANINLIKLCQFIDEIESLSSFLQRIFKAQVGTNRNVGNNNETNPFKIIVCGIYKNNINKTIDY